MIKELDIKDVEKVSGGNPFALGVAGGIVGNYIYESMGGAEGINSFFSTAWNNDPVVKWVRSIE
ncbi:hypothetical protein SG34_028940 [Thalassomonas viridans]|uniref:Bacteriocin n=1 Tax=Thalassomonas viridans TaxID=137584 RepID=A0AAE9Z393_9GAMM|nr:hypothetical protein [Thalassomonas viridans]WDE05270.1 hypothetical protein SG34_028940 [Thalassomonas viridans]